MSVTWPRLLAVAAVYLGLLLALPGPARDFTALAGFVTGVRVSVGILRTARRDGRL